MLVAFVDGHGVVCWRGALFLPAMSLTNSGGPVHSFAKRRVDLPILVRAASRRQSLSCWASGVPPWLWSLGSSARQRPFGEARSKTARWPRN